MLSDSISEQLICKIFYPIITNSALTIVVMTLNSSWAGQLSIVDFSVVTPYIPDPPPKEKS